MKIVTAVIDATAVVAFCLNEEGLNRERLKSHLLKGAISVDLVRVESANAILVSRRRGLTRAADAKLALSIMLELAKNNLRMVPQDDGLISDAFEMSETFNLAVYDLLYLSLAKRAGAVLLSKDEACDHRAPQIGADLRPTL